ncbi:MAG: response regulator transcription factor [Actinobacteria bacterium]|nr:response regulator transcription factor [Actinomycetota bacterium]
MGGKGSGKAVAGKASIRVLVVDDHIIVRQGLRLIMDEEPDMEVAGEASSVEELMNKIRESEWDVVLLDITLPDRSGLEALEDIRAIKPGLPVLVLSMHPEEQYASQALKKGASGYLSKESAAQEVVKAIRQVVDGGVYTGRDEKDRLSGKGADETGPAAVRRRRPDTKRR